MMMEQEPTHAAQQPDEASTTWQPPDKPTLAFAVSTAFIGLWSIWAAVALVLLGAVGKAGGMTRLHAWIAGEGGDKGETQHLGDTIHDENETDIEQGGVQPQDTTSVEASGSATPSYVALCERIWESVAEDEQRSDQARRPRVGDDMLGEWVVDHARAPVAAVRVPLPAARAPLPAVKAQTGSIGGRSMGQLKAEARVMEDDTVVEMPKFTTQSTHKGAKDELSHQAMTAAHNSTGGHGALHKAVQSSMIFSTRQTDAAPGCLDSTSKAPVGAQREEGESTGLLGDATQEGSNKGGWRQAMLGKLRAAQDAVQPKADLAAERWRNFWQS